MIRQSVHVPKIPHGTQQKIAGHHDKAMNAQLKSDLAMPGVDSTHDSFTHSKRVTVAEHFQTAAENHKQTAWKTEASHIQKHVGKSKTVYQTAWAKNPAVKWKDKSGKTKKAYVKYGKKK